MAIEQISTGYKPEFALGALYHGFNAGNADNASRLANLQAEWELQKSQAEDPYKVMEAILAGNRANAMNDPEMLKLYTDGYGGQMESQIAAGKTAKALQPFKQEAEIAAAQLAAARDPLFANMYSGIGKQHDKSLDPDKREAAGQGAYFLADTLSQVDPKNMFQERMLGTKLEGAEDLLGMRLAAQQRIAGLKERAVAGDKNAQQALVTYHRDRLNKGEITPDEFAMEMAQIFNRLTAPKIQPGQMLSPEVTGNTFVPKPETPPYVPNASTNTAKPKPATMSMTDFRSKYPQYAGKSDDEIRKAFKQKTGEDLQ